MARINGWTHLNRVHRAPHDSGQNEAKRYAAIGEALVTGQTIRWNYFQATDGLDKEQIDLLSVEEIKKREEDAVEHDAWHGEFHMILPQGLMVSQAQQVTV